MANNYRQFCEVIQFPDDNAEEALRWWHQVAFTDPGDFDTTEEFEERLKELGIRVKEVDTEFWPDFQCDTTPKQAIVYAESFGNVANLAEVVHAYLKKFAPNDVWTLEWADYCDRTRSSEFSGGVVAVSAKEVLIKATYEIRNEYYDRLKAALKEDSDVLGR